MKNNAKEKIVGLIKESKRSLVLSHLNPDGDTLGSMLALGVILKKLGHVVDHVVSDPVPEVYKFLPFSNLIVDEENKMLQKNYDLAFSLDCGSLRRLGRAGSLWLKAGATINIDHHVSNERFGQINWIEPGAISTGHIVYFLAQALKVHISREMATLFYTTLLTDTGCFSNSNTSADAMKWASELILMGADHEDVYKKIFLEKPFKSVKMFGTALGNLNLLEGGKVAWTYVNKELFDILDASSEDAEDIADYIMRVKGVLVGVFFREDNSEIKVSLRSNSSSIDVCKIALTLGGGGHKKAAGANIKSNLITVKDLVLAKVIEVLKENEK